MRRRAFLRHVFTAAGLNDTTVTANPSVSNCCGTGQSAGGVAWGGSGLTSGNTLFYFTGPGTPAAIGAIDIASNAPCIGTSCSALNGSPPSSTYKGMLFFIDRNAAAQRHIIDGETQIILTGTIYANNSLAVMQSQPTQYQTCNSKINSVARQPVATSKTVVVGELITNALDLQSAPNITVNLNTSILYAVDQVALVQ